MLHYSTGFTPVDKSKCTLSIGLDPVLLLKKKCHHFWSLAHFDLRNVSTTMYFVHRTRSCTVTIEKWI